MKKMLRAVDQGLNYEKKKKKMSLSTGQAGKFFCLSENLVPCLVLS